MTRALEVAERALEAAEQATRAARALLAEARAEASTPAPTGPAYYDAHTYPAGRRRFYADARAGRFPVSRVGKRLLARREDVEEFIASARVERPAAPVAAGTSSASSLKVERFMAERGIRWASRGAA